MAASTYPRRLLGQVLALFGLDGGNARALANAGGILADLHAARAQVDALEVRIGHGALRSAQPGGRLGGSSAS